MIVPLRYCQLLAFLLLGCISYAQQGSWTKTSKVDQDNLLKYRLKRDKVQLFELDQTDFSKKLKAAPLRSSGRTSAKTVELPGFNGKMETFYIYETPTFSPSLSAKYPNIKSYTGYSKSNAELRMSVSPKGVQTMITYLDKPTIFMQPVAHGSSTYVVYDKRSKTELEDPFECHTVDHINKTYKTDHDVTNRDADDQTLRSFRLAVSVNGEYTAYHGGTTAGALAAINATLTRVNAVFETDMAVTFELVDAPQLIYLDAGSDPYSDNLGNWNVELQNTLTNTIGNAAYDIGHMFGASGGGGNAGCIGCVCVDDTSSTTDENKGAGITSPADDIPEGDNFDIDYVAHEIGHQMGANHTFSHQTEGTGVNSEPGSGTTIMGYAGITGANNVQQHSDAYFHYHSINQVLNNLESKTCWVGTGITNNAPVANAGPDYVIPQGTAYVLRGSATDADGGDNLTYCWEQIDNGQVTNVSFGPTLSSGSMNRSLPPSASPDRYIPKLSRVIDGKLTQVAPSLNDDWETVATVGRIMNWAMTVRDRDASATGLNGQSSFDTMQLTVDANSGPFAVTSQSTNVTWDIGSTQLISWDVAGTDSGAVNAPTVNIKLSLDGGNTYPFTLASNIANNGSAYINVPEIGSNTSTARVMVEANNNIFYALNSTNFTIEEAEYVLTSANPNTEVCKPNDVVYNFVYNTYSGFSGTTTFSTTGLPAGATAIFNPTTATADDTPVTLTISGTGALSPQEYTFNAVGTSGVVVNETELKMVLFDGALAQVTLASPGDGATEIEASMAALNWNDDTNAQEFDIEIATDSGFGTIVESATVSDNEYSPTSLLGNTEYFWRVKAKNLCGEGAFSSAFSFTTKNIQCHSYDSSTTPLNIPDNNSTGVTSVISIPGNEVLNITDLNVTVNVIHPWIGDLTLTLISPQGTEIILVSGRTDSGNNYTNTVFDDDAVNTIASSSAPYTGSFKPEGSLASLNGEYSAGDWTLKLVDGGPADIGSLTGWSIDLCGSPITTLPNNNFIVQAQSETCRDNNNGAISITASLPFNYRAELTGNGLDATQNFTTNTEFPNLIAGTYTVCLTVDYLPTYEKCYEVVITEPEDLSVFSKVDLKAQKVTLELSGGAKYFINLNGTITETSDNEITLTLKSGVNHLKITTDKECQGSYERVINNAFKPIVSPNPISNNQDLNIYMGDSPAETIEVSLYSIIGKRLFSRKLSTLNGETKVDVSNISSGIYLLHIKAGNIETNHKIIKK